MRRYRDKRLEDEISLDSDYNIDVRKNDQGIKKSNESPINKDEKGEYVSDSDYAEILNKYKTDVHV